MALQNDPDTSYLSSGISGLDYVMRGGFVRDRLYLIEGAPGSGKTTMALQFLLEGVKQGEPVLYVTLSESKAELRAVAAAHGWSTDGLNIQEILPSESILNPDEQYTIFHPSDVEMSATTQEILRAVEARQPARIVIDSLSELQLLASGPLAYRRQVLALKQFFASRSSTVLLLDDRTAADGDLQVRSIAHAVITLDRMPTDYGGIRRRLEVAKYRGIAFREGVHDYKIRQGGLTVFPRLVAAETREVIPQALFRSEVTELDALLGGGIEEGTSTLIAGPPGTGKSTLATQFVAASLRQQERAAIFIFEESKATFLNRAESLGMELRSHLESGRLSLEQIDPAQLSPGEFTHLVCEAAEQGAKIVVIDSLNGFLHAMPNEKLLAIHLHELLTYLGQRGVVTFLVGVQQGMLGNNMITAVDASYFADNVIMLRYFEAKGEVRRALSVFKKRSGPHERTIRQLSITPSGLRIGPVLSEFQAILTGVPRFGDGPADEESAPHG